MNEEREGAEGLERLEQVEGERVSDAASTPTEPRGAGGPPEAGELPGAEAGAQVAEGVSPAELAALQAAEDAKGDPELDEIAPAAIEVAEGEREEPFEKLAAQAKRLGPAAVRNVLEALLFLAEKPLGVDELCAVTGLEPARVRKGLDELSGKHREGASGIVLHEVAGGWQLRSAPEASAFARRFLRVKPQRLTRAALETLALVAYRQPVTRPEIEDIRGVDSGAVVKALLERRLIKILGKKEEPGRPILYGTSREFLEFFALKDLASLPTLREFHELSEEHRDIVEKEAPPDPAPRLDGLVAELSDPALRAAMATRSAEGDKALEELEAAMETAESKGRAAAAVLEPRPDPAAPPAGEGSSPAAGADSGTAPGDDHA